VGCDLLAIDVRIPPAAERTLSVLASSGPSDVHELVIFHELQHTETMRQALFLGGQPGGEPDGLPTLDGTAAEWIEFDAGEFEMGAEQNGSFVYDNELPRHRVTTGAFAIQNFPVTNATWLSFAEGGGYEYRPWWSEEGWSWKQCYDITHPLGWEDGAPGDMDAPVQHVSWFDGYPGFVAHPYREYSEVFFGAQYRVLRGGSWATDPRVATLTFRNWDLPQRRQIFAGVRLATDPEESR